MITSLKLRWGYDDNDVVVDHIQKNLMTDENAVENVVEQVENGDVQRVKKIPRVHADWLNDPEQAQRGKDTIQSEIFRRLSMELAKGEMKESEKTNETRPNIPPTFNDVESDDDKDEPATNRE